MREHVCVIGTWLDTRVKEQQLFETINKIKAKNIPVCVVSHCYLPEKICDLVDYIIYDKENILIPDFKITFIINEDSITKSINYHGLTCYMNIKNAINFFAGKFDFVHYIEYDTLFDVDKYFEEYKVMRENGKKALFVHFQDDKYRTDIFSLNSVHFRNILPTIDSVDKYNKIFGINTILEYGFTNFINTRVKEDEIVLLRDFQINTTTTTIDVRDPLRKFEMDFSDAPLSLRVSSARQHSFYKMIHTLYHNIKTPNIVEIGVTRKRGNLGDGDSTSVWSWFVSKYGGSYYGCDISEASISESEKILREYITENSRASFAALYKMDGNEFIKKFINKIDLLYLDSLDCTVNDNTSGLFHLNLLLLAIDKVPINGYIMIDDILDLNTFEGKGKFVVPYLLQTPNFKCIHKGYQFIFRRDF
jgi:hypothetical protein